MIQMVFRMDDNLEGYTVQFYHVWDENTQTFGTQSPTPAPPPMTSSLACGVEQQGPERTRSSCRVMVVSGAPTQKREVEQKSWGPQKSCLGVLLQQLKFRACLHTQGEESVLSAGPGSRETPAPGRLTGAPGGSAQELLPRLPPPKRKLQACYSFAQDRGLWSLNSLLQAMFKFLT